MTDVDVLAEDLVVEIRGVLEGDRPVRPGRVFDLDKLLKALEGYLEAQKCVRYALTVGLT